MSRVLALASARREGKLAAAATALAAFGLLLLFVVWPVVKVLALSVSGPAGFTLGHVAAFFGTWQLVRILVHSLAVSLVSTALTVGVALVLAYAVTRTTIPGKRFIALMGVLPLISPPFLASLGLILLFGRTGVITRGLGVDGSIQGFHGIVVAQVFTFLPHAYILLANVLGSIDTALEEAAESLGAGPLTTLRRVTLALARGQLDKATATAMTYNLLHMRAALVNRDMEDAYKDLEAKVTELERRGAKV